MADVTFNRPFRKSIQFIFQIFNSSRFSSFHWLTWLNWSTHCEEERAFYLTFITCCILFFNAFFREFCSYMTVCKEAVSKLSWWAQHFLIFLRMFLNTFELNAFIRHFCDTYILHNFVIHNNVFFVILYLKSTHKNSL